MEQLFYVLVEHEACFCLIFAYHLWVNFKLKKLLGQKVNAQRTESPISFILSNFQFLNLKK
ncbi:hypothetical protein BpHYR1_026875 [Brachionus plicatilis]|uniref:Uncharacterized protein n=1 Tax=Brachionus plicatilis TaxID=10195 RepID=A0A3M7RD69_BRAPC|nr:hypothetical protein BpHYR1_026875 [Brachionus plicatilis]